MSEFDPLSIKTEIMQLALENDDIKHASMLTAVGPLCKIYNDAPDALIYCSNDDFTTVQELIYRRMGRDDILSPFSFSEVLDIAAADTKHYHFYLLKEEELEDGTVYEGLVKIVSGVAWNIRPIVVETSTHVHAGEYLPTFINKDNHMITKQPFFRWQTVFAEGYGRLEGKAEADNLSITAKFMKTWSKRAEKQHQLVEDQIKKLHKHKDANK